MTHVGHVSLVWDHAHWISGKILPQFDPSHFPVAHLEAELVRDTWRHVATRVGHVSRVWDHVHWIPGEILPQFHVRHLSVALLELELENYQIFRTAILGKLRLG